MPAQHPDGYDAEGDIIEYIPVGGCSYMNMADVFSFWRLPEDEQLLVIPFVMRTLHMAGLGECDFGPLHPKDEEVTKVRLWYLGTGKGIVPHLHNQILFSIRAARYPNLESVQEPQGHRGTREEKALGLISRSLFVGGGVTYPLRDEVLISHQVPTGYWNMDCHMRTLVKCVNNLAFQ